MSRWGRDTGLSFRMFVVMFLLTVVYLAFIAILISAGVSAVSMRSAIASCASFRPA
jgi:heat shock protein HtpX